MNREEQMCDRAEKKTVSECSEGEKRENGGQWWEEEKNYASGSHLISISKEKNPLEYVQSEVIRLATTELR